MKALWQRYAARLDAMTLRERVTIFAAAAAVLVAAVYSLWIDPDFAKGARLSREIAQRQAEMKAMQDEIGKLGRVREADPDRLSRERLARLKEQLQEVDASIAAEERKFTAPEKMRPVLEELLARNRRVALVQMKTLPVTSITEERNGQAAPTRGAKPAPAAKLIYRHGLELTVSGSYADLLAYLADLEKLPTQLYWSSLALETVRYPTVQMKLVVYTMSLDRAWLSV